MTILSITVAGKSYSIDATEAQIAGLSLSCAAVMAQQTEATPPSQRKVFKSDREYLTYIFGTIPESERSNVRLSELLTAYARDNGLISDARD